VESDTLKRREDEDGAADLILMRRIADGERNALAELYARHGGVALAFARRTLKDDHDAEEAVQDAFVSVWRRAGTFRSEASAPRTWLLTIVRNRCIDSLRRRRGDVTIAPLDENQPEAFDNELWPEIWKRQCGAAVRSAMGALPPEQREVIELGFYGGLSHSQIAERLALPLGTLKKRMRSGLKRLRDVLDESYSRSV
jgi:RNA polymerase sigma-70 factor (ECF subfamily)